MFASFFHLTNVQCEPQTVPTLHSKYKTTYNNGQYMISVSFSFLARDVIYTSRAYAMMPVRLSVCDGSALAHYS